VLLRIEIVEIKSKKAVLGAFLSLPLLVLKMDHILTYLPIGNDFCIDFIDLDK